MSGRDIDYDIVIAGGGMIGTSLALALAPLGLNVAMVEAVARGAESQPSFDDRSTALSRSSQRMFTAMGLWDRIAAASTPIRSIHVSDKGRFGFSRIDADEQGVEALGYVVINRVLGEVLQSRLRDADTVDVICPARIVATTLHDDHAEVAISAGDATRSVTCRLVVAADGARSSVREMLGIGVRHVDYEQCAIIGNLLTERPHENRAYERFTDSGPIAMLPVSEERSAFVWILATDEAESAMMLDDDAFTAALQETFGRRLGRFSKTGKRASYPLTLSKALSLTGARGVVVGNAAHGLHPIAAQGFNLGLRDVAALSDCIADTRSAGETDVGAAALLERYKDWRHDDQQKLVRFTDGLVRLFGSRRAPVRTLRNLGMLGFDLVPGVRRLFAKHTMGLAGRLPRLSRGVPLE